MKKIIIIGSIIVIIVIGLFLSKSMLDKQKAEVEAFNFQAIDMNEVADGTYLGEVETSLITVRLVVEVTDHKITNINLLEHQNGFGKKAEKLISIVVENNTYDVANISGATSSSLVIKYAINFALRKGVNR